MGIDGLHRVEVLQVPGQVVPGREGGRSQLVVVLLVRAGAGIDSGSVGRIVVVVVVVVMLQRQSVAVWTGISIAVAVAMTVMVVWCRHDGVPRARQHSGRALL